MNIGDKDFKYEKLSKFELQIYSINLSIFICYYLRLTNKSLRKQLVNKLDVIFQKLSNDKYKFEDFLKLPIIEEYFIANNIDIPEGIAKNNALLENLFALFVCINNKIPLFIVGKPGCSKSLSVEYILKSMRGDFTKNTFFKHFPNLMCTRYQGSLCSQSEDVINIFKKAENSLKKIKKEDLKRNISMIYFDEMGLAEHSKFNPLKTIHAKLEFDETQEDTKIAFVGISNWPLDASKMNRGIRITISDLDLEDNIKTSLTIAESFDKNLTENEAYKFFFETLGKTYFKYKKFLKENINKDWKKEFHGHRDFYFFVKISAKKALLTFSHNKENSEKELWLAGIESIERNFSGLEFEELEDEKNSIEIVKNIYKEEIPKYLSDIYNIINKNKKVDVVKLINDNLSDPKNRYLLLIAKPSISCHLLNKILGKRHFFIFIGSKFKNDFKSEDYHYRIINQIQICMEKGGIIVLKDFDYIYPALYDLLNQNFTVESNRNFARVSLGTNSTYCIVNDNFKCIIIVDKDKIQNEETPFVNRFEKFIISFKELLSDELIKKADEIYNTLKILISRIQKLKIIEYELQKILVNFNLEEIQALVYEAKEKGVDSEKIHEEVISKLALTFPQDVMLFLKNVQSEYKNLIIRSYNKGEHRNLSKFLSSMKTRKNVVYTFSSDLDIIKNLQNIKNEKFNFDINKENIKEIKIRGIKSEGILEREINSFLQKDKYKVCLIHFTSKEENFMNFIKIIIDNKEKEEGINQKIFIFIVHMNRIFSNRQKLFNNKSKEKNDYKNLNEDFSFLSEYYQIFIDNLNGDKDINFPKIIESKNEDIIEYCLDVDNELKKNIYKAIIHMRYNFTSSTEILNKDNYVSNLKSFIQNDKNKIIRKLINNCIKNKLNKDNIFQLLFEEKEKDYQDENKNKSSLTISEYDIDLISLIKKYLFNLYISAFNHFLFIAENDNFFSSLLYLTIKYPDLIPYLSNINEEELLLMNKNEIKLEEKSDGKPEFKLLVYIILNYFKEFSFERNDTKFIERQQGVNNINILLGLSLPGFKKNIEDIISKINESVIINYNINETSLINIKNLSNRYYDELERLDNLTRNEIIRCNKISKIHEEFNDDKNIIAQFYNLFINDYYILFIIQNLENNTNIDEAKRFFDEQVTKEDKLRYDENLKCAKKINYIESYKNQITLLLKIYYLSKEFDPNPYNFKINNIFIRKDNNIEILSFIQIFVRKIIIVFNNIKDITKDILLKIKNFSEDAYLNFSKVMKNINSTYMREIIYSFREIAEILVELLRNNIYDNETIKIIFTFYMTKTFNIIKEYKGEEINTNKILEETKKAYKMLNEKIGKNKNFPKLMNFLLINDFKQIRNDNINNNMKNWIIETVLSNNQFLKNFHFDVILDTFFTKDSIKENFDKLNENIQIFYILNNQQNKILEQILLYYFENNINYCFEEMLLKKEEKNIKEDEDIISEKTEAFKVFERAIFIFSEIYEYKNNYNLKKLYSIAYIKIYLKKFVKFILENVVENNLKHMNELINNIKNEENKNIIKLYTYKLFHTFIDDKTEFLSFNYENKYITFLEGFKSKEKQEKINYYYFAPISSLKKDYTKVFKLFNGYPKESYLDNNKRNEFIKKIKDFPIEIFINISINKVISKIV